MWIFLIVIFKVVILFLIKKRLKVYGIKYVLGLSVLDVKFKLDIYNIGLLLNLY